MRGIVVKYNFNLIILIEAKQCDGGIIAPAHFRKAVNISEQQSTVKAAHNAAVSCAGNGFTVIFGSDPFYGIPYSFVGMPHRLAALGREILRMVVPCIGKPGFCVKRLLKRLSLNNTAAHFTQSVIDFRL